MRRDTPLILMLGASLNYPGGMTEVVRSYAAAGHGSTLASGYVSTYEGRRFSAKLWPWLAAIAGCSAHSWRRRVARSFHVHKRRVRSFWRKSVICALAGCVPRALRDPPARRQAARLSARRQRAHAPWLRFILRKAHAVVVLTRRWRDEVQHIEPAARVSIIGNPGAGARLAARRSATRRASSSSSAWLPGEGIRDLIAARRTSCAACPKAELIIAGGGAAAARLGSPLDQLARALGVEHALRFAGWSTAREAELLREADVFVLPSYCEARRRPARSGWPPACRSSQAAYAIFPTLMQDSRVAAGRPRRAARGPRAGDRRHSLRRCVTPNACAKRRTAR